MNHSDTAAYIREFFGYGNLSAPLWFVGMEEGGKATSELLQQRVEAWKTLHRGTTVDLKELHHLIHDGEKWFAGDRPPLQSTWRALMRILFAFEGRETTTESIRAYQKTNLGTLSGSCALLELMPLPSPRIRDWPYAKAGVDSLASREKYLDEFRPHRLDALKALIEKRHKLRAVVFYGYRDFWREAFAVEVSAATPFDMFSWNEKQIILTPHPAAHGWGNQFWSEVGRAIRER